MTENRPLKSDSTEVRIVRHVRHTRKYSSNCIHKDSKEGESVRRGEAE